MRHTVQRKAMIEAGSCVPVKLFLVTASIASLVTLLTGISPTQGGPPTFECKGLPATVVGTSGPDEYGEEDLEENDVVVARGGGDRIENLDAPNLTACGNGGWDSIGVYQGSGRGHVLVGGPGNDRLGDFDDPDFSYNAVLRIFGGGGDDTVIGGGSDDRIFGKAGQDRLFGFHGGDYVFGGAGRDLIRGDSVGTSDGEDELRGGSGADRISGDYEGDILLGGTEDDFLKGNQGTDRARGGAGDDRCQAEQKRSCEG